MIDLVVVKKFKIANDMVSFLLTSYFHKPSDSTAQGLLNVLLLCIVRIAAVDC